MKGFSKSPSEAKSRLSLGHMAACLTLYSLVMAGVHYYAHNIGVVGGLLTILAIWGAACWYDRRQKQVEISPKDRIDDRLR